MSSEASGSPSDRSASLSDAGSVAVPEAWTIQRILQWSTDFLKGKGSPTARLDAEILIAHTLGLTRIQLYTGFDKPVLERERGPLRDFLRRRGNGEPVAYITGQKDFMGLSFVVSRDVLIPRPDTEILVEAVQAAYKAVESPLRILDVGTGSGCIAIALAKAFPEAAIFAWDNSEPALAIARVNAERLETPRVVCECRDARDLANWQGGGTFDLVVANPPYIDLSERSALPVSVRDFEPASALFAASAGLEYYELLVAQAPKVLRSGGRLFLEIGSTQADAVVMLLTSGQWRDVRVLKDYGRHDRVVEALAPLSVGEPAQ